LLHDFEELHSGANIIVVISQLCEGLKHNLVSISQLCDQGYKVVFEPIHCFIFYACGGIVLVGKRVNNIYLLNLHHASNNIHCLLTKHDDTWL